MLYKINKTSPEPTSSPRYSASLTEMNGPWRGYTLVSSPSKRPILSTFLSMVAWHVISLAHSIGNQPLSPSRSRSPSYQPAEKNRALMKQHTFGWVFTLLGSEEDMSKFQRQYAALGLCIMDNERWEKWNSREGFKGNELYPRGRTGSEALKGQGWESVWACADLGKGVFV